MERTARRLREQKRTQRLINSSPQPQLLRIAAEWAVYRIAQALLSSPRIEPFVRDEGHFSKYCPTSMPIQPSLSSERVSISFEPLEEVHSQWRSLTRSSPRVSLYHSERWIETLRLTYGFRFRAAISEHDGVA